MRRFKLFRFSPCVLYHPDAMPRLLITVIFAVALVKGVAFATKERSSRSNCNVEMATHCCQNMTSSNDPRAMQMLEYFGLPIPKEVVLVGRNCTQANETATW